jgi:hypothetical protein
LGSLALLSDGGSADPALIDDWKKCVEEVIRLRAGEGEKPWNLKLE